MILSKSNKQNYKLKGFGLMEALLVLSAGAIFIMGALYLYSNGSSQANIQDQIHFISSLNNKVKNNYLSSSINNIKNISTSSIINDHIVSKNKINNNTIYAYIGNHNTVIHGSNYNNKAYVLYSTGHINKQQCIKYSKLASSEFDLVGISHGSIPTSVSSLTILQNKYNNKQLSPTNLVSQCQSGKNNTVSVANTYGNVNITQVSLNTSTSSPTTSTSTSTSSSTTNSSTSSTSPTSTSSSTTSTSTSTSSPTTSTSTSTSSTTSTFTSSPTTRTSTSTSPTYSTSLISPTYSTSTSTSSPTTATSTSTSSTTSTFTSSPTTSTSTSTSPTNSYSVYGNSTSSSFLTAYGVKWTVSGGSVTVYSNGTFHTSGTSLSRNGSTATVSRTANGFTVKQKLSGCTNGGNCNKIVTYNTNASSYKPVALYDKTKGVAYAKSNASNSNPMFGSKTLNLTILSGSKIYSKYLNNNW